MPGRLEVDWASREKASASAARADDERIFRILVVGDFGGRGRSGRLESGAALSTRRSVRVDVDNFDDVLAQIAPRVNLDLEGAAASAGPAEFRRLDDFHPDALYRRLELFRALRDARQRLLDPSTAEAAAAEIRAATDAAPLSIEAPPPPATTESNDDTLARLLGARPEGPVRRDALDAVRGAGFDGFLRAIVAPYIRPDAKAHDHLVAAVDLAISERMRQVLHAPAFQEVDALWRSVHLLITRLETGEALEIRLLDLAKAEVLETVKAAPGDLDGSILARLLLEPPHAADERSPFSLLVAAYEFAGGADDVAVLAALGALAGRAGATVVAAAAPALFGFSSFAAMTEAAGATDPAGEEAMRWQSLRRSPAAHSIGLAAPRILLRLPYGAKSDPIEAFTFEERDAGLRRESFSWGNPAFGCALLLGANFLDNGWTMDPDAALTLDDLPAYAYTEDGDQKLLPCAEVFLGERAIDAMLRRGVMPWVSHASRNRVRLARFQSLADPPSRLAGPWS